MADHATVEIDLYTDKLAKGAPGLQRRYGIPIVAGAYPRVASSEPACRAVVATRRHTPESAEALLRALRVRTMAGGLLDDPKIPRATPPDSGACAVPTPAGGEFYWVSKR